MKTSQRNNSDLFLNLRKEVWMTCSNILNIIAHQLPDSNWCWQMYESYSNENNYNAETLSTHTDFWGGGGGR